MMRDIDKRVPCYNCDKRHVESGYNCHSDCPDYKVYKDAVEDESRIIREKKARENDFTEAKARAVARTQRLKQRMRIRGERDHEESNR